MSDPNLQLLEAVARVPEPLPDQTVVKSHKDRVTAPAHHERSRASAMTRTDSRSHDNRDNRPRNKRDNPAPGYDPHSIHWKYINADGTPDEAMLDRVTRSIVKTAAPRQIILFGSAARGEMNETSDVDILVVTKHPSAHIVGEIYYNLPGNRRGADILTATSEELEENGLSSNGCGWVGGPSESTATGRRRGRRGGS